MTSGKFGGGQLVTVLFFWKTTHFAGFFFQTRYESVRSVDCFGAELIRRKDFQTKKYQVYEKHRAHMAVIEKNIKPLISPGSRAAIQCLSCSAGGRNMFWAVL